MACRLLTTRPLYVPILAWTIGNNEIVLVQENQSENVICKIRAIVSVLEYGTYSPESFITTLWIL